jgi:hypothetical protein
MQALRGALSPLPLVSVLAAVLLVTPGLLEGIWVWPTAWVFLATFGVVSCVASGLLASLRPASFRVRQQGFVAPPEKNCSTSHSRCAGSRPFHWMYSA